MGPPNLVEVGSFWATAASSYDNFVAGSLDHVCPFCQLHLHSEDILLGHSVKVHGILLTGQLKADCARERSQYSCEMCQKPVKRLLEHLQLAHPGIQPEYYYMKYLFNDWLALPFNNNCDAFDCDKRGRRRD